MQIERVRRPFWAHQIVEYLVGVLLISAAIQQPQPMVPAVLGLLILLNAATAKGGASAFSLFGRRLHRQVDVVVMVLLVAGAVQPWISLDNTSRFMLAAIAFVMFFVWFHTDFTERVSRKQRKQRAEATTKERTSDSSRSEDFGRGAGRVVGKGINSAKRWKDSFGDDAAAPD